MQDNKGKFNLKGFLDANNVKLKKVTEDGQYIVETPEGEEKGLNVNKLLLANKINPAKTEIQYNTPEEAIPYSPISNMDRLSMDISSQEKGNISFLKKKFEDVTTSEKYGIVVKNKGVWHQADPSFFGNSDPWEVTKQLVMGGDARKELIGDVAEFAQEGIDTAGAIMGGTAGALLGPTGAGLGGVAGATAAAKYRFSLGRLLNTYEATPEEEFRDTMYEAILGMGGEIVGAGVKAGAGPAKRAFKKIAESAGENSKQLLSSLYKFTLGVRQYTADKLASTESDALVDAAEMLRLKTKKAGLAVLPDNLNKITKETQSSLLKSTFEGFKKEVYNTFGEMEGDLLKSPAASKFNVNVGEASNKFLSSLSQTGILTLDKTGKYVIKDGDKIADALMGNADLPQAIRKRAVDKLQEVLSFANTYAKKGALVGADGADAALKIRRTFKEIIHELTDRGTPVARELTQILREPQQAFVDTINQGFYAHPELKNKFINMNNYYAKNIDIAREAGKIASDQGKMDTVLSKIWTGSLDDFKMIQHIQENTSNKFRSKAIDMVKDLEAAKDFVTWIPQPKNPVSGVGVIAANVAAGALAGPAGLAAVGGLTSPKAVSLIAKTALRTPKYGTEVAKKMIGPARLLKDGILSLTPENRRALVGDARALSQLLGNIMSAPEDQDNMTKQLIDQGLKSTPQ